MMLAKLIRNNGDGDNADDDDSNDDDNDDDRVTSEYACNSCIRLMASRYYNLLLLSLPGHCLSSFSYFTHKYLCVYFHNLLSLSPTPTMLLLFSYPGRNQEIFQQNYKSGEVFF